MCIACRQMRDKKQLIRVVVSRDNEAYQINQPRAEGRGAYVCKTEECIDRCCRSKLLNKAFKCNLPATIYDDLKKVELNEG